VQGDTTKNMAHHHTDITGLKLDHEGKEVWRYNGAVLERTSTSIQLEAFFNRDRVDLNYVVFERGDRFVEYFYTDRWYNIFAVYAAQSNQLKGWYCNFARPAVIADDRLQQEDLALDLWVYPDRRMLVLDEDEFAALPLLAVEREAVSAALTELQKRVSEACPPFDVLSVNSSETA